MFARIAIIDHARARARDVRIAFLFVRRCTGGGTPRTYEL